jgi:hypothetical protein
MELLVAAVNQGEWLDEILSGSSTPGIAGAPMIRSRERRHA